VSLASLSDPLGLASGSLKPDLVLHVLLLQHGAFLLLAWGDVL